MHNFKYNAAASVCALLLLGSACASEDSGLSTAPRTQAAESGDAGPERDAARSDAETEQADAAQASEDAGAERSDERASGGSGGSRSTRAGSSQGGAGGATARSSGGRAGSAGQSQAGAGGSAATSEPEAVGGSGGAGGARAEAGSAAESTSSPRGGAGGARAEAGSEAEGAAGEPAEPSDEEPSDEEPAGSQDAGAPSGSDEPTACQQIATACGAVSEPSDDVSSCLRAGQASDESTCRARIESCRQSCGAPLCQQVLVECPATGSGSVQGCHQIGVTDNAGDCFGDGVKCLEYCREVAAP